MPKAPLPIALSLVGLLGALGGAPLAAQDVPEDLRRVIATSKLRYEVTAPASFKKAAEELHCVERSPAARVVRTPDGGRKLEPWLPAAAAAPHFTAAEKLFAEQSYAAAGEAYKQGLEKDPAYGPGWLFLGDIPFAAKNFPVALEAYRHALALDPTLAPAHRFAGDALTRLGRFNEAEDEYVRALVYDPSSPGVFEALGVLGAAAGFTVARHEFSPPAGVLGEPEEGRVRIGLAPEQKAWVPYFLCRAIWRNEPAYRRQRLGPLGDGPYSWTVQEETECLVSLLVGSLSAAEAELQARAGATATGGTTGATAAVPAPPGEVPLDEILAAVPPEVRHLKEVADAGLLSGYALYAVLGRRCPLGIALLPDRAQEDLERYIRRFVLVRGGTVKP